MAQWAGRTIFLCDIHVKITENLEAWRSLLQSWFKEKRNLTSSQFPVSWQGRALFSSVTICVWTALWVASAFTLDSNKEQHSAMGSSLRQCMHRLPQRGSMALFPHPMISTTDQPPFSPQSPPPFLLKLSPKSILSSDMLQLYLFIQLPSIHPHEKLQQEKVFDSLTHSWTLNL